MTRIDVVNSMLGPAASAVAPLRGVEPKLAAQMQDYYDAVFSPPADSAEALSLAERWLIAIRTASHTGSEEVVAWYTARALDTGIGETLIEQARTVAVPWNGAPRMTAIMRHVDLIVTRPVDSSRSDINALINARLSPAAIVVLSQVVAYVSYQLRLVAVLRALGNPR